MGGRPPGKPAYLWLWYANGKAAPDIDPCTAATSESPPVFTCTYGTSLDDCQRQVQTYLDAWYASFNLVFTFTRPPSGDYYTMVITSGWPDCQDGLAASQSGTAPSDEAGAAPPSCTDVPGETAIAIECGKSAHTCATLIAHEHGHMVGLEHTTLSTTDVMNMSVLPAAAGFDDQDLRTAIDDLHPQCKLTQNSYHDMLAALGAWPGGAKPGPFATVPDAGAPDLRTADGGNTASTSGSVGLSPQPPLPTVATPTSQGGCNLASISATTSASPTLLLLVLALLARQMGQRWSVARSRRRSSRRA